MCAGFTNTVSFFMLFVLLAIKGIRFQRKQARLSEHSLDEQIKILDTLGDLYCQVKAFHKALGCYKKEVLQLLLEACIYIVSLQLPVHYQKAFIICHDIFA